MILSSNCCVLLSNCLKAKSFKTLWLLALLLCSLGAIAQEELSSEAEITILTCGPGDELYSAFGHSAIRIYDPIQEVDWVYNYGTFDFDEPNFYLNFIKGSQQYYLSKQHFNDFAVVYYWQRRWVRQQKLNLDVSQKQQIYEFLEQNLLPENCAYAYDFFYSNCATRVATLFEEMFETEIIPQYHYLDDCKTIRTLIKEYTTNHLWGQLGIDLLLGSKLDRIADPREHVFLPDYLFRFFENALIEKKDFAQSLNNEIYYLLSPQKRVLTKKIYTPFKTLAAVAALFFLITLLDVVRKERTRFLDFIWLFSTGLVGLGLLFLWFFTNHGFAAENYNIIWLLPFNMVFAFFFLSRKYVDLQVWYARFQLLLLALFALLWFFFSVQSFNISIAPMLAVIFLRFLWLSFFRTPKNTFG